MDEYNEWMSEEDYEVDDNGRKKVHKVVDFFRSVRVRERGFIVNYFSIVVPIVS